MTKQFKQTTFKHSSTGISKGFVRLSSALMAATFVFTLSIAQAPTATAKFRIFGCDVNDFAGGNRKCRTEKIRNNNSYASFHHGGDSGDDSGQSSGASSNGGSGSTGGGSTSGGSTGGGSTGGGSTGGGSTGGGGPPGGGNNGHGGPPGGN